MNAPEDAFQSRLSLADLRPKLTRRLLDNLSISLRVSTVGELLTYVRDRGAGRLSRIPFITRAEENRLSEALENFWLGQARTK